MPPPPAQRRHGAEERRSHRAQLRPPAAPAPAAAGRPTPSAACVATSMPVAAGFFATRPTSNASGAAAAAMPTGPASVRSPPRASVPARWGAAMPPAAGAAAGASRARRLHLRGDADELGRFADGGCDARRRYAVAVGAAVAMAGIGADQGHPRATGSADRDDRRRLAVGGRAFGTGSSRSCCRGRRSRR